MLSGIFYLNSLERSISYIRGVWLVLSLSCSVEISEFNANIEDPDQTHSKPTQLTYDKSTGRAGHDPIGLTWP